MGDLKASFTAFASYGAGGKEVAEMESKNFFKCIKDSGLIDKALTQTDCDLIFTKVKTKGARKINFAEFCAALEHVAAKKKVSVDEVKNIISSSSAKTTGTIAEAVKYHDDKSLYSGVYANGGPTNVDREKQGLQNHLDRSEADVRGVKKH
eukprot:CAMPEP_0202342964 /NCGR_PEP_ID=MMETSP1126-20121109/3300_1 /ASSEMBLY_ACC=CAM_ASM_000457 /TAXON_ID=3047 /ORGANISM="Dunaliella tertiolecta, Strain CCMP1320" /LENGTH=150 /DNA_ID=CAMNT_0048933989 /DNA_START=230 /DNA_END=682 /DNA_ORIENTATION=-